MKKSNINLVWIIYSLVFNFINSQEWKTLLQELNPTNGSGNWKKDEDGSWKSSSTCQGYYGDGLADSSIQRYIGNNPKCINLKISIDYCKENKWETNDNCQIKIGSSEEEIAKKDEGEDGKQKYDSYNKIIPCSKLQNLSRGEISKCILSKTSCEKS